MGDPLSPLSDDEVRQIAQLVETLENSPFDFLQMQVGDVKVTLGKGSPPQIGAAPVASAAVPAVAAAAAPSVNSPAAPPPAASPSVAPGNQAPAKAAPASDGATDIVAPLMGRYYAQSEPGAPPFVTVGGEVTEDTTIALIEVMKTFTAVKAETQGIVTEICVGNEDLVEYGQVLLRVRPAA